MTLTNEDLLALSNMMDQKLQHINNRLDKIESDISSLKVGQRDLKKEMRQVKDKVSDTYDLALEAWGQSTENRAWLENNQATG